jgi:hypothetical protein
MMILFAPHRRLALGTRAHFPRPVPWAGRSGAPLLLCRFALIALAGAIGPVSAQEPAHRHGAAELRIVVDGPQLQLALETPLDNLIGFEHAPRNDKQRTAVRAMAAKLRQPQKLFTPTPAARCTPVEVTLESAVLSPELLGEKKSAGAATGAEKPTAHEKEHAKEGHAGEEHADLDASFTWRCEAPEQLKGMDVGLMQAFPGLRKLEMQVVGPRGQSAAQLTPAKRTVTW